MKSAKTRCLFLYWISNSDQNSDHHSNILCQKPPSRENRNRKIYAMAINSLVPVCTLLLTLSIQPVSADSVTIGDSECGNSGTHRGALSFNVQNTSSATKQYDFIVGPHGHIGWPLGAYQTQRFTLKGIPGGEHAVTVRSGNVTLSTATRQFSCTRPVPVNVPYSQRFNGTRPQAGWEYNSSAPRIEVVDGALRMTGVTNDRFVTNRAILHVDLSTTPVPFLRYLTTHFGDEVHRMPYRFSGSATGDGVAISDDGINWHRIDTLDSAPNRTFAAKTFNLAQIARDRNLTLGSDVRILFQQHDNYPLPWDGRAFDDISIISGNITPQAPPRTPSLTLGPNSDLSEVPINYWSIGSVEYRDTDPQNRLSIDTFHHVQGNSSIQFNSSSGTPVVAAFPTTRNANWDLRESSTLRFKLFVRAPNNVQSGPEISLISGESRYIYKPTDVGRMFGDLREKWTTIEIPLQGNADWTRTKQGDAQLGEIDAIEILLDIWGYGLAFWIDDVQFDSGVTTVLPNLRASDLDLTYIERTPRYERYDVAYDNGLPIGLNNTPKLWPSPGERVKWTAHIANRGQVRSSTFNVQWIVNGSYVQRTRHAAIQPGAKIQVDFPFTWRDRRDYITAKIVPDYKQERTTVNNKLTIATDALTYGFYVEETTCAMLNTVPNRLGSTSCEDWLTALINDINQRFSISKYDFAPRGVTQRVRIDKIEVVPDGSLAPYFGTHAPNDLEVDGVWGYQSEFRAEYKNHNILPNEALTHELMHQLGVIDTYTLNIGANNNAVNGEDYWLPYRSMMGGSPEPTTFSAQMLGPHSVYGLNSTQGYRRGYYGDYLLTLPKTTRVQLVSANNRPLANTQIKFYQTKESRLDGSPKFTLNTDNSGIAVLPNYAISRPGNTTQTGHTLTENPFGDVHVVGINGVFLVEFVHNGVTQYETITVAELNLAYGRGMTDVYTHTIRSSL